MNAARIQTHVSLDTADLPASVAFYRALLGEGPSVERADYARFDLAEPALVLGLNSVVRTAPAGRPPSGAIEHLGIRYADDAGLRAAKLRLGLLGAALVEEPDTECCYARLARAWAADPSGVRWELFVVREEVVDAPSRAGAAGGTCCEPSCCATDEP
jgi:catechol 2,3-dioxygenase-like lactoylglutathione lyase family enzyme